MIHGNSDSSVLKMFGDFFAILNSRTVDDSRLIIKAGCYETVKLIEKFGSFSLW